MDLTEDVGTKPKFGLPLPHFGAHASVERCIEGARRAEAHGFHSVWVRDHLVFEPHGIEGTDNTHIEGLLALSATASVTKRLILGTAMTICHRSPIHLAQAFAGLSAISNGRVIMGMGLGGFPHEFAAAGLPNTRPTWQGSTPTSAAGCGPEKGSPAGTATSISRLSSSGPHR